MRYDLISPRKKKDGGTFWHKVGVAFPRENGGFALSFDSLPLPDEAGKVFLMMSEHTERQSGSHSGGSGSGQSETGGGASGAHGGGQGFEDEGIPFAPGGAGMTDDGKDPRYVGPSPYDADEGHLIGLDPRQISGDDLRALGHPTSWPKCVRAKCRDCVGSDTEIRKCVQYDCPLWPMRMGRNPFHARAK